MPLLLVSESTGSENGCFFYEINHDFHPDIEWKRLSPGDTLGKDDAILTCESSSVEVKSDAPFYPGAHWEEKGGKYIGAIPSNVVVIAPSKSVDQDIQTEVLDVSGDAFYSSNRELNRKYHFLEYKSSGMVEREQRYKDMKAIGWEPLSLDHQLGPWDMIWTRGNGRAEIEVLKEGKHYASDRATDVIDSKGKLTRKKRLPRYSFLLIDPDSFSSAKVNKVIGEVWVATDPEKVKLFFKKHKVVLSLGAGAGEAGWREMLRKEELE
jgi:hypothetical protein